VDIPSFLQGYPPFDELEPDKLADVVRHTHIEFFPAGTMILQQAGEPSRYLYIVRTGAVEVLDATLITDFLGEGEVFGHFSLLSGMGPAFSIRASEDAICYLVDLEIAEEVMGTRGGLSFLSATLRRRETRALDGSEIRVSDPLQMPVSTLVRRPPMMVPVITSVREAAELMTTEHVTAVLVERVDGYGIVTDRDMRARVLAPGRSADTALGEVLTSPVVMVDEQVSVAKVMSLMLENGIHHVPVTADGGRVIGLVTDADLIGLEQITPFVLKNDIERSIRVDEAVAVTSRLPMAVTGLIETNVDPLDIAHAVAVVIDSLTRRLLELGIRKFGDPPCRWCWLALGSEARQEQALLTDQDNALVIAPRGTYEEADPYFERLAAFVNDHLQEAGFQKCRAGVIASNPEWRGTLDMWKNRIHGWITEPSRVGSAFTGIAFDYRQVTGSLEARSALDDVIRSAADDPQFIRHMARLAVDGRPPTGFLKDAVVGPRGISTVTLDVKHSGIALITNLARVYAVSAGLSENRTLMRLEVAAAAGRISQETRRGLEESFRLLWQTRLEHQAGRVLEGAPPDDLVDPRMIGSVTRQALKEGFRVIERAQDALVAELGLRR
jgi:CBS domain-containing protein